MSNNPYTAIDHDTVKNLINELDELPNAEYNAEIALINSFNALETAKLTLELQEAAQFLLADGKTVKDKEAMVMAATEKEQRELITKQVENLKKKAEYNKLVNKFAAVRKKVGAIESMLNSKL